MALVDSAPDRCQHPRSRRAPSFPLGCRWGSRGISTESGHEPTAGPRTPTTGSQLTLTVRSHLFLPAKSSSRPRKSSNGPRGSGGPGEEEGNRVPESPPRTRALVRSARSPARALPMVALLGSSRGASASASAPASAGAWSPRAAEAVARRVPAVGGGLPAADRRRGPPPGSARSCCPPGSRARAQGLGSTARRWLGLRRVRGKLPLCGGRSPRGPSR